VFYSFNWDNLYIEVLGANKYGGDKTAFPIYEVVGSSFIEIAEQLRGYLLECVDALARDGN
jgi:hypothetical protein